MPPPRSQRSFTLIELLIVVAVIAVLATVVIIVLNPAELLRQSRDGNRISDMRTMSSAVNLYSTDQSGASSFSLGSSSVLYISVPDASSTCGDLGMPALPSGWTYHCASSSTYRNANGTGWLPVAFSAISSGNPLGTLPVDPVNQTSTGYYYTYATNGAQFELTALMESQKYNLGGSNDVVSTDGGILPDTYEAGTIKNLLIADRGREVTGEWLLDEGTGTVAYDSSLYGNNGVLINNPTWTTGINGNALSFNGVNQEVDTSSTDVSSAFTLSLWMKTTINTPQTWFSKGLYIGCADNYSAGIIVCSPNGIVDITAPLANDGNWHNISYVSEGGNATQTLYIDGSFAAEATGTPNLAYDTFNCFASGCGGYYFQGAMEDIRTYDRALTPSGIAQLYTAK